MDERQPQGLLSLRVLARLLDYPCAELQAAAGELAAILDDETRLPEPLRKRLGQWCQRLAQSDLLDLQEAYVELSLPVFKHLGPLMDELSFDAAYRGADYSTVGKVGAYKFSGTYGPLDWLKFRSTYSRSVRAPSGYS